MSDLKPEAMRLNALRQRMKEEGIDAYIITKFDPHQSEYGPAHWNGVNFISGFTGSAAMVAITMDKAGLWTDGRYYIQAEKEIEGTGITLYRAADPETKPFMTWVKDETPVNGSIGFNGLTLSAQEVFVLQKKAILKNIKIHGQLDFIEALWEDRPSPRLAPVYAHSLAFCGEIRTEKLERLRKTMTLEDAHFYFLSSLDDIAWLLNLRGSDFENAPLFSAYTVIEQERTILFMDQTLAEGVLDSLKQDAVEILPYDEIFNYAKKLDREKIVMLAPARTNYFLYKSLEGCRFVEVDADVTTVCKAVKNKTELANWDKALIRDGVAMVRFMKWLKETVKTREIPESEIADKLSAFRKTGENYLMPSFDTIAAYMENGALMHYRAVPGHCAHIQGAGFLLVDSGAHYLDGTTDITRTFVLGDITEEMKKDFTLVAKAHIRIAQAIFLYGLTGSGLDILARQPLWTAGLDYKSGTGHGIGYCLGVHEGPQRISMLANPWKLEAGMVMSNEPGCYKKGRYGIRTENMIKTVPYLETEDGTFLCFETISYCPIDREGIDKALLTSEEISWLNTYHQKVYEKLRPGLTEEEDRWLAVQTQAL